MALALVVDDVASVPETVRSLYVEKDGKFHLDVTGGEDVSGLKTALQKERDAAKDARRAAKDLEERFAGIDPAKVRDMMSKLDQDGEAALIAAGKIDEVISKRTERLRADMQKQLDAAQGETKATKDRVKKYERQVLDNQVRAAAAAAGVHKGAIEDALFRARTMFKLDDADRAVQVDEDGNVVLGKDGKTPFGPVEWLEGMKDAAPHWFPAGSSGGGASGGKETTKGEKTIKRSAFNELSSHERAATARTHRIVD